MENNSNENNAVSRPSANKPSGVFAIIVVGIFVLCVIFILAKGLFASNSAKVPSGLDTATINTDESSIAEAVSESTSEAETSTADQQPSDSDAASDDSSEDDTSDEPEIIDVMYVTEYAYLHVAPDNEAENIVCMSPGVEVNVLGYEDNGYVKITFVNIDGPLTGYIYKDYLASYSSTTTTAPSYTEETEYNETEAVWGYDEGQY